MRSGGTQDWSSLPGPWPEGQRRARSSAWKKLEPQRVWRALDVGDDPDTVRVQARGE